MTNDQAFDILENALRELPKGSGWREQAHQALLHIERERGATRVALGPMDALDAIGVQLVGIEEQVDEHTYEQHGDPIKVKMVNMLGIGAANQSGATIREEVITNYPRPGYRPCVKLTTTGVFLTEEQLKQYWSMLAYGE